MLYSIYTVYPVRDPESATCQNYSIAVLAGSVIGGIAVCTLAMVGIVCGACKLKRHQHQPLPADSTPTNT